MNCIKEKLNSYKCKKILKYIDDLKKSSLKAVYDDENNRMLCFDNFYEELIKTWQERPIRVALSSNREGILYKNNVYVKDSTNPIYSKED